MGCIISRISLYCNYVYVIDLRCIVVTVYFVMAIGRRTVAPVFDEADGICQ